MFSKFETSQYDFKKIRDSEKYATKMKDFNKHQNVSRTKKVKVCVSIRCHQKRDLSFRFHNTLSCVRSVLADFVRTFLADVYKRRIEKLGIPRRLNNVAGC